MKHQTFYEALGKHIRIARTDRGMSQQALANLLEVKRVTITNIELGRQSVLAHTLFRLTSILQLDISKLFANLEKSQSKPEKTDPETEKLLELLTEDISD